MSADRLHFFRLICRFLYVFFQVKNILEGCVTDNDIRNALRSLPEGLEETFIRILTQIDKRPKLLRTRLQRVLRLVVCFECIEIDSLIQLLDIAEMGDNWDPNKTINDPFNLISGCGHLISATVSTGSLFVTLTHLTVQQFLTCDPHSFDPTTLSQYHCYPLRDAFMETASIFLKKRQMRGCPYPTTWHDECQLISRWRRISDFEASTSGFLSMVFNAPLNENARPGPSPEFPNATRVIAKNCRFIFAEDVYYILTSSQLADFSRGPYIWDKVFPQSAQLIATEIECFEAPCGIYVQDDQQATIVPVGNAFSRSTDEVIVMGIDFILATNSNWTIYPGVETIPGVTETGGRDHPLPSNCIIDCATFYQFENHIVSLRQPRLTENWLY